MRRKSKAYAIFLITLFFICEGILFVFACQSFLHPIKYKNYIKTYAEECNISPHIIASIINVESGFNSKRQSKAGAIGLMQIMPDTANYICQIKHIEYTEKSDLLNPKLNIKIGCYYFRYLLDKFHDFNTTICAYNAGETTVINWLKNNDYSQDQITLKNIPYKETKNYLNKINKNIKIYKKYII